MYSATLKAGFKSIIWEEMSFKWTTFEETNGDQSSNLENIQFQTKIIHAVETWHKHKIRTGSFRADCIFWIAHYGHFTADNTGFLWCNIILREGHLIISFKNSNGFWNEAMSNWYSTKWHFLFSQLYYKNPRLE